MKTTNNIIRKLTAVLLVLVIAMGLPAPALAAETDPPDWYFLFAIFKNVDADCKDMNGKTSHQKYTIPQEQIDGDIKICAQEFETYMNSVGVMRAHVDIVEIDQAVTEADFDSVVGAYINVKQAESVLKDKVNLDRYDHVFCISSLNEETNYGSTIGEYENGVGHAYIGLQHWDIWKKYHTEEVLSASLRPGMYIHEFLHFTERLSARFGERYYLHNIGDLYGTKNCFEDIMLNRAKGDYGTGVAPEAWQYPPHVFRTTYEWTIPSSVTNIGKFAFWNCVALNKITIPGNVVSIEPGAFMDCTNLSEVTICPGVTRIEDQVFFGCTALTKIYIPASMTSIREVTFYKTSLKDVYYGGTEAQWKAIKIGEHNGDLTRATIHYNSKPIITSAREVVSDIRIENDCAVGSVTLNVQNEGDPSELSVYIGCYDSQGRMSGVERLGAMVCVGENTLTLQLSGVIKCKNETGLQFRAFLLDSKFSPLYDAIQINQ